MWKGWFSGAYSLPSDYPNSEMPCSIHGILIGAIFVVPYVAFLLVLPAAREKRIITLAVFTITMLVGGTLIACLEFPGWTIGHARLASQFRAHTRERMLSDLGVNVGLQHINITLRYVKTLEEDNEYFDGVMNTDTRMKQPNFTKLFYNEQFDITGVSSMADALRGAYLHGLPYPMLSVLEYFSLNQDAFDWGRHYRVAGHYAHAAIWLAIGFWCLAILLLLFLPHYYGRCMLGTGLSSIGAVLIYVLISPTELSIAFVGADGHRVVMDMKFGWCIYLTIAQAILSMSFGMLLIILQHYRIYVLSTFLDASLDETVGPYKRRDNSHPDSVGEGLANSLEVMRRCKTTMESTEGSEKQSSGIHSRSSYTETVSRSGSFTSVHNLSRSPSSMTINEQDPETIRHEDGVILHIEKF